MYLGSMHYPSTFARRNGPMSRVHWVLYRECNGMSVDNVVKCDTVRRRSVILKEYIHLFTHTLHYPAGRSAGELNQN